MINRLSIFNLYYQWWKNIDKFLFSIIILLFSIGLFFSLVSTSLIASDKLNTNNYSFFLKHLIFIALGVGLIFIFSLIDQENLMNISLVIFLLSLVTLFLVPIIGVEVKGSKRWIDLYLLPRFQPIELVKPFLIIFISITLSSEKFKNIHLKYSFSFLITLMIVLLLAVQPDIGQTLLVLLSWSILIFISGISISFLILFFLYYFCLFYF